MGPRPTSGSRSPGSRTSSCSTGPTPTSAATRSSTCSKGRSPTCSARSGPSRSRASTGSTCVAMCSRRSTHGWARPAAARCGKAGAAAGTRRPRAAIPTTGPTTPSSTGTGSAASTSAGTGSCRNVRPPPVPSAPARHEHAHRDRRPRAAGGGAPGGAADRPARPQPRSALGRSAPTPRPAHGRLAGAARHKVVENLMNGVRTEVVTAGRAGPERTVVHFHGGGYCVGSPRIARTWAAHLSAQSACRVVLPEYRLAPEHPHPAALDDARDAMKALLSDVAVGSIVLSGDSAGAGLALALALALRDEDQQLPAGCILVSPWLDLGRDRAAVPELVRRDVLLSPRWLKACATAYADPPSWSDPSVSPLLAEPGGLPPLLIQAGTDDLLAPDAEGLAARAS